MAAADKAGKMGMRCSPQDRQGQQPPLPKGQHLTLPLSGLSLSQHLSGPQFPNCTGVQAWG